MQRIINKPGQGKGEEERGRDNDDDYAEQRLSGQGGKKK